MEEINKELSYWNTDIVKLDKKQNPAIYDLQKIYLRQNDPEQLKLKHRKTFQAGTNQNKAGFAILQY